jgi:hypothetical protein
VERKANFANAKDPRAYCEMILLTRATKANAKMARALGDCFFTNVCNNKSNKNAILQMGFVATPFLCIYTFLHNNPYLY